MYVVIADIPGVSKDRVNVTVKDDKIMIEGKRKKKVITSEDNYLISERRNGIFKKMLQFCLMPMRPRCRLESKMDFSFSRFLVLKNLKVPRPLVLLSILDLLLFATNVTRISIYFFFASFSLIAFKAACSSFCFALKALSS